MEIQIISDVENPLLKRRELQATVAFEGATPSRNTVILELSKKIKVKDTHIEIKKIQQRYGKQEANVIAYVYEHPVRERKVAEEVPAEKKSEGKKEESKPEGSETGKESEKEKSEKGETAE